MFEVKLKRVLLNFTLSRYAVNGNFKNLGRSGLVRQVWPLSLPFILRSRFFEQGSLSMPMFSKFERKKLTPLVSNIFRDNNKLINFTTVEELKFTINNWKIFIKIIISLYPNLIINRRTYTLLFSISYFLYNNLLKMLYNIC